MDIRVLQYFLAVAREESITGAAEALHMTQPPLSRQLKDLEDELGKQLFIRGNRRITLTEEGMILRKRAEQMVELMEKTKSEISTSSEDITGDIYIGGGETDAMRLIAQVVRDMQKNHPGICCHLYSGNAEDVTERLDRGLLDFGILIEPADIKKYDYLRLPATDTWGLLMPKDCDLAKQPSIRPEHLRGLRLICSRQSLAGNVMSGWFGESFEKQHIVATYNLIYNAALMVEEGVGYALCLDKLVDTQAETSLCFRPLEPPITAHLDIVWKKYQAFTKAAQCFLDGLQKAGR